MSSSEQVVEYLLCGLGVHEVAGRASTLLTYAVTKAVRPVRLFIPEAEAKDFLVYEVATRRRDGAGDLGAEESVLVTKDAVPANLFSSTVSMSREILERHEWSESAVEGQLQYPWYLKMPALGVGDQLLLGLTNRSTFTRILSGAFLCLLAQDVDDALGMLG